MPSIQDLIPSEEDRSLQDLEDLSGGAIKRATWGKWRNGQMLNFPEPGTIETLAKTLNLPVTTVVLACARTLGLDVETHRTRLENLLPPKTEQMTTRQMDAVLSVVDAMINPADGPGLRAVARKRGKD